MVVSFYLVSFHVSVTQFSNELGDFCPRCFSKQSIYYQLHCTISIYFSDLILTVHTHNHTSDPYLSLIWTHPFPETPGTEFAHIDFLGNSLTALVSFGRSLPFLLGLLPQNIMYNGNFLSHTSSDYGHWSCLLKSLQELQSDHSHSWHRATYVSWVWFEKMKFFCETVLKKKKNQLRVQKQNKKNLICVTSGRL